MDENYLIVSELDFVRLMSLQPPAALRAELERAIVVPEESIGAEVVRVGSRVRYSDCKTGQQREVELVLPGEADMASARISVTAPVGAALIGLAVGDEIDWDFPDGSVHRLRVEHVAPGDGGGAGSGLS